MHLFLTFLINQPSHLESSAASEIPDYTRRTDAHQRWLPWKKSTFPYCVSSENEPSVYDLQSSGGAPPVGGFIYRGCQSRRLYGSYVFGDKNG